MVTLFKRKIFDKQGKHVKTSLYFDYYAKGQKRVKRFINLNLLPGKQFIKDNNKTLSLVTSMLQEENNKLAEIKSIDKIIEKPKEFRLLPYIQDHIATQTKSNIYTNIYSNLTKFILQHSQYNESIELKQIDYNFLENWKHYLINTCKLNPNTARAYFVKFNTVLNKAVKEGILLTNPCKQVSMIKPIGIKRDYLTIEEIQAFADIKLNGIWNIYRNAFLFSCFTGLRRLSVYNLKWSEIKDGQIQRRDEKTGDYEYFALSQTALELLKTDNNILDLEGKIFQGLSYRNMTPVIQKIAKRLNIDKDVSFHTGRRTYATLLQNRGVDLYTVSKLLGHADIKTTQIYAQVMNVTKQNAVNLLPELKLNNG